jgi:hypothetical protein
MFLDRILFATLFVLPSRGMRRQSTHLNDISSGSNASSPLRIHAVTYNAGNFNLRNAHFADDLIRAMLKGHESSDIVLVGLQEYRLVEGSKWELAENMRRNHLWHDETKRNMGAIAKDMNAVAAPPENVRAAKDNMASKLKAVHEEIRAKYEGFRDHFKDQKDKYLAELASSSHVKALAEEAGRVVKNLSQEEKRGKESYEKAKETLRHEQFGNISSAKDGILAAVDAFPNGERIHQMIDPIMKWTADGTQQMKATQAKYPNLQRTDRGEHDYKTFKSAFVRLGAKEQELIHSSRRKLEDFRASVKEMHSKVVEAVSGVEDPISNKLLHDWRQIQSSIKTLSDDLAGMAQFDANVSRDVMHAAKAGNFKAKDAMEEWFKNTNEALNDLFSKERYEGKPDGVDVLFEVQRYYSGTLCNSASRGDTLMFVFANPWSEWVITPVQYSSSRCQERKSKYYDSKGCNIDNNKKKSWGQSECGKVVNLMVWQATRAAKGEQTRICVLNTHMSFDGSADQRAQYIAEAADEIKDARCDTAVFVGDFNTRLHCRLPDEGRVEHHPPYERCNRPTMSSSCLPDEGSGGGSKSESSFQYIFDQFCKGEKCALRGNPKANYDEMASLLSSDHVSCFEGDGSGKPNKVPGAWQPSGGLKHTGFFEPGGLPDFAPTYKVEKRMHVRDPLWTRCFSWDPQSCFHNEDKKGKHNPAWTDRVLVRSSGTQRVEALEYSRRPIDSSKYGSDHIPVVARLEIFPGR